jgi:hypothetical protein
MSLPPELEPLRVWRADLTKVRLGRPNDGGYVVCDGFEYDAFLSGGIGSDTSFELAVLARYGALRCHAYDPGGLGGAPGHSRLHVHAERVRTLDALLPWESMLVKLDVEGAEWAWLRESELSRVLQVVLELHATEQESFDWAALGKLASTHACVHAHANNMSGLFEHAGVRVPQTLETTWVRRGAAGTLRPSSEPVPGPFDQPNDPKRADLAPLAWEPFVSA